MRPGHPSQASAARRVIVSADDFGLSEEINEAVEQAHARGVLSTASLMVAGPAAADAVARARRLPNLRVGLHLVAVEGPAILTRPRIPLLLNPEGRFGPEQFRLSLRYVFRPDARAQLADEIAAQFGAFAATGLALDHANAHKHMHLHPTVGRLLIETGKRFGLRAIRIPFEPAAPLLAADGTRTGPAAALLRQWTRLLRAQARRAGLAANDACFGLTWTGRMTVGRVCALAAQLPAGVSEIYFHPACSRGPRLAGLMPDYRHEAELETLCADGFRAALEQAAVDLTSWDQLG